MTVALTGTGGFFTRSGAFIGEYNRVAVFYGSGLINGFQSIWSQFVSSDQAAVANLPNAVTAFQQTGQSYGGVLQQDAVQAVQLQVSDDTSVVPYTLTNAVQILANQMKANAQSINRPTLTAVVTPNGANLGDAVVIASTTNIYGDPLDMTFSETFTITANQPVVGTSFTGTLQAVGQAAVPSNAWNWPQGSGASASIPIIDAASGGLTTDGGFAQWEGTGANTPSQWSIANGNPGVTVFQATSSGVRAATSAAKILSDGSSATQLYQDLNLNINTVYAVSVFAKINSLDASGTFRIALTDQNGNVINNDAGTPLAFTRNVNGQVTTNYQMFTAFFSTPRQLPITVNVQVGFSVAATAGKFLLLDLVGVVAATPLYGVVNTGTSGPFVASFAADLPTAFNDKYSLVFTNSLTTKSFALGSERLYGLRELGVYYPSSNSPTISDTLVTN